MKDVFDSDHVRLIRLVENILDKKIEAVSMPKGRLMLFTSNDVIEKEYYKTAVEELIDNVDHQRDNEYNCSDHRYEYLESWQSSEYSYVIYRKVENK